MSGTGQPGNAAPARLTPLAQDQPLGHTEDGKPVYAEMWFRNALQRLQAFLGQPASPTSGGGGAGLTVSEQLSSLSNQISQLQVTGGSTTGLTARVAAIEAAAALAVRVVSPPLAAGDGVAINNGTLTVTATTGIYAPLVNGDLPGPTLIADSVGQCIMVQIA